MHQPLNATETLQLANDLTERNEIQEEVIAWKKKHSDYKEETDKNDVRGVLGAEKSTKDFCGLDEDVLKEATTFTLSWGAGKGQHYVM